MYSYVRISGWKKKSSLLNVATIQKWRKTHYNIKLKSKTLTIDDLVFLYDHHLKKIIGKFKLH